MSDIIESSPLVSQMGKKESLKKETFLGCEKFRAPIATPPESKADVINQSQDSSH